MNIILLFMGLLIPVAICIKIWNTNQINLARRVSSFISTKSASQEIKQNKRKSSFRKRVNDSEGLSKLLDSAEFGDLLAIALTAGQNPRASIDTISEFLPTDFKDGIGKAIRENAFGKPLMLSLIHI